MELRLFFTALMFLTRLPIPSWVGYEAAWLNKSQKYFPLVGLVVGGLCAAVYWLCSLVFSPAISIILMMCFSVLLTGAFHEDGFTDSCDAFGGGYGKEKILTIMKDSRIGAYGMVGMSLLFLLKFQTLMDIKPLIASLLCAHSLSRFMAVSFVYTHIYVQDLDVSKAKPIATNPLTKREMLFAFITAIAPLLLFGNALVLLLIPLLYGVKMLLGRYFVKHIGGYTGDCLGATQQICEVVFYLGVVAIWRFM